jgi:hypothetical protein
MSRSTLMRRRQAVWGKVEFDRVTQLFMSHRVDRSWHWKCRSICPLQQGTCRCAGFKSISPGKEILSIKREMLAPSNLGPMVHPHTQQLGDTWLRQQTSVALAVPGAVIPEELNYLINPHHPAFRNLIIHAAEPFCFDNRLHASG